MAKKFSPAKFVSFESQVKYTRSWSSTSPQTKSYAITTSTKPNNFYLSV